MRILMLTESFRIGGKERRIIELLKKLELYEDVVCEVIILKNLIEYSEVRHLKKTSIRIIERKIKKDPSVIFKIAKITKAFNPDIVHSWGPLPSIVSFPVARFYHKTFINNMISNAFVGLLSKTWFRAKLSFPFSNVIVSNSQAGLDAYKVRANKGRVIYNGFDFKRLENLTDQITVRGRFDIRGSFVVGMVGVFHERKDFDTFFSAAKEILLQGKDLCFIAVGNGPYLEYYKAQIGPELERRILLPGSVNSIESLINVFDIGVLTTNTKVHQEGISNSIMEYMALGKPVIATKGGGTSELIQHNKNGLLIEPFSKTDLIENILDLYNNPLKRAELGKNARETIQNSFSMDQMAEDYIQLYESVIAKRNELT